LVWVAILIGEEDRAVKATTGPLIMQAAAAVDLHLLLMD
jgi:hypothetical protein